MRSLGTLFLTMGGLATLSIAAPAQAQNPLSRAEINVCKSLAHCLDITARHGPHSYDYAALHQDYLRFGDKAKQALLQQLSSGKPIPAQRAQTILAKGGFKYTAHEQRKIAALWPSHDLRAHKAVMLSALSPLMRARAIETLPHQDPDVRAGSQEIIQAALAAKMNAPLSAREFDGLAKAAALYPSPALAGWLSTADPAKSRPVLTRLLRSGDGASVIAAYNALHRADPKAAFHSLLGVLRSLENTPSDARAAFAISALLRHRHSAREDGFYLGFAKGLSEDVQMSAMGRAAGLDALLQSPILSPTQRPDTAKTQAVFANALVHHQAVPQNYIRNFAALSFDTPDPWIGALSQALGKNPAANKETLPEFIAALGRFKIPKAQALTAKALGHKTDFNVAIAAILASHQQDQDITTRLTAWRQSHPISLIRTASQMVLDGKDKRLKNQTALQTFLALKASRQTQGKVNRADDYCAVGRTDFKDLATALPFFEGGTLSGLAVTRGALSAATPLKDGWLAGYDKGAAYGGLIYYDYASENAKTLLDENIRALAPTADVPLGQYARDFWVVTGGSEASNIYRAVPMGSGIDVLLHAVLPAAPTQIQRLKDGSLILNFSAPNAAPRSANPPLRLFANGAIDLACKPAQTALPKALP